MAGDIVNPIPLFIPNVCLGVWPNGGNPKPMHELDLVPLRSLPVPFSPNCCDTYLTWAYLAALHLLSFPTCRSTSDPMPTSLPCTAVPHPCISSPKLPQHISEFVKAYNVTVGDVVGIARNPDGSHSIEVNTQDMIQHALRNAPSLGRLRHHLREKPDAAAAAEAEDAEEGEGRPPPPAHPLPQPGPRGLTHTEHLSGFGSGLAPLTTGTGRGPLRPSPASPSLVTATRSPLPLCPAPHTARPPGPTPSTAPHSRPTAAPSPPRTTRTPARSISAPPASPTSLPAMRQPQPTDPRAGAEASGGVAGRTAGGAAAGRAGTGSAAGGSGGVRKILVAKALTQSDALYRRITLPRRLVEVNMPEVGTILGIATTELKNCLVAFNGCACDGWRVGVLQRWLGSSGGPGAGTKLQNCTSTVTYTANAGPARRTETQHHCTTVLFS